MIERRAGQPACPGELAEPESAAEFVAYDVERWDASQPAPGEGAGTAAEFGAFRRGRKLNGQKSRDLIGGGHDRPSLGDRSITAPKP